MPYHTNPRLSYPIYFGTDPIILQLARDNRHTMTASEKKLWKQLKERKIMGMKFRRQHPVSRFITDFYCHEAKLVIEVDGGYHLSLEQKELDHGRTKELEDLGLKVIRFRNEEIEQNPDKVVDRIRLVIRERLLSPSP